MTARDEVLAAVRALATRSKDGTFSVKDVVRYMRSRDTAYAESTIRTHVVSRMCANAPSNHGVTYDDLIRVADGTYRLNSD
jgi:hypothetical protein